jgi:hypothetical protein
MSLKSFFDRSFFVNLLTMPLKGAEWEKINKRLNQQRKEAEKHEEDKSEMIKPSSDH